MMNVIYDIETYPQFFSAGFLIEETGEKLVCEYSFRRNDIPTMLELFAEIIKKQGRMVGFNNIGFDYPVIHHLIKNPNSTPDDLYNKAMQIISGPWEDRFKHIIWDQDTLIPQVDLLKIHHFDNVSRFTSLKTLEFNMRRQSVEDLPFAPGTLLDWQQYDKLVEYMWEDIDATAEFYRHSKEMIAFRDTMTQKYGRNFTNDNDTKIGKEYFIMKMQQEVAGFDKKQQTIRDHIRVSDIVFPYITFGQPEFNRILRYFKDQVIRDTKNLKGVFKDVSCTINGFTFVFGAGGIHGSVESTIVESDAEYIVEDWDVASYYPNIAIANDLYPEHLGASFCQIYRDVYEQRKLYPKGSVENAALKLALNGVYGDSNNEYSCFYDPQYTLSITVNGQLLLCMLAENLLVGGCQMVQINTDGLTIRYPRQLQEWVHKTAKWWEQLTRLTLENVEYKKMYIRDVNSYIGEYHSGKLKRIGAYAHETPLDNPQTREIGWHKDHSALVVPKAAEACLVRGQSVREFIENHDNPLDFMLRAKVNRGSSLITVDYKGNETVQQNTTRYYISCLGEDLIKIMPPLKGKIEPRRFNINKGWKVTVCNRLKDIIEEDIDHEWYIAEAEKLTRPLLHGGM
ncbi:MAG: hypothetical protein ACNA8H_06940 [Anaerolineales bacterium]